MEAIPCVIGENETVPKGGREGFSCIMISLFKVLELYTNGGHIRKTLGNSRACHGNSCEHRRVTYQDKGRREYSQKFDNIIVQCIFRGKYPPCG